MSDRPIVEHSSDENLPVNQDSNVVMRDMAAPLKERITEIRRTPMPWGKKKEMIAAVIDEYFKLEEGYAKSLAAHGLEMIRLRMEFMQTVVFNQVEDNLSFMKFNRGSKLQDLRNQMTDKINEQIDYIESKDWRERMKQPLIDQLETEYTTFMRTIHKSILRSVDESSQPTG